MQIGNGYRTPMDTTCQEHHFPTQYGLVLRGYNHTVADIRLGWMYPLYVYQREYQNNNNIFSLLQLIAECEMFCYSFP